ncbi:MAG: DUF814 domain-containing protein [Caldilineaceae bacterium]|nr:DUF814 domain-containing protein [Caldilineaceae bacterium]
MERAARIIPIRRDQLKADLDFLEQLQTDLLLAENQPEIAAVEEELGKAGLLPVRQKRRKTERVSKEAARARHFTSSEGFEILVGRSARQNEIVTFRDAHPQDWWLHARGAAGSHVVIRNQGQEVAESTLEMAAQLAAYYSKARGERAAEVLMTERRFVNRASGGRTGQVHVRNAKTLVVPAQMPEFD